MEGHMINKKRDRDGKRLIYDVSCKMRELTASVQNISTLIENSSKMMEINNSFKSNKQNQHIRTLKPAISIRKIKQQPYMREGQARINKSCENINNQYSKKATYKLQFDQEKTVKKRNIVLNRAHSKPNCSSNKKDNQSLGYSKIILKGRYTNPESICKSQSRLDFSEDKPYVVKNRKIINRQKDLSCIRCRTVYEDSQTRKARNIIYTDYDYKDYDCKEAINRKLFEKYSDNKAIQEELKDIIASRKFIIQPPTSIKARISSIKQPSLPQTLNVNYGEVALKFLQKIRQFHFIDKYLSQVEIWGLYDKIIKDRMPEISWTILIVDALNKRMELIS